MREEERTRRIKDGGEEEEEEEDKDDYYKILRVKPTSDFTEIRKSFIDLIKLNHPDKRSRRNFLNLKDENDEKKNLDGDRKGLDEESHDEDYRNKFSQKLIEAYKVLSNPIERERFDSDRFNINNNRLRKSEKNSCETVTVSNVIDLSQFTLVNNNNEEALETDKDDDEDDELVEEYYYDCRCGGQFQISSEEMKLEIKVISCNGCSSKVLVEYQIFSD